MLAAYQPAGADLRMVAASLEMVAELERIADYAADVARILLFHSDEQIPIALFEHVGDLGNAALAMFHDAMLVDGRTNPDPAAALAVAARDDQVDALQR